jgi:hypothetical protein
VLPNAVTVIPAALAEALITLLGARPIPRVQVTVVFGGIGAPYTKAFDVLPATEEAVFTNRLMLRVLEELVLQTATVEITAWAAVAVNTVCSEVVAATELKE